MFQVKGVWEDGSGNLGVAQTIEEAVGLCDAKACSIAWFYEGERDCLYQVKKGVVLEDGVVVYTKQRELQPLFDSLQPLHKKLYEAEENIALKVYQVKKLMDLDAKQTNAPISLSGLITGGMVFSHNIGLENDEDSLKKSLQTIQTKLQKAQYLAGQLDEWVIDMVEQTGYKGILADL